MGVLADQLWKEAWAWCKKNWWLLPFFIVIPFVFLGAWVMQFFRAHQVIDPTVKADSRAQQEAAKRQAEDAAIRAQVESGLDTIKQRLDAEKASEQAKAAKQVQDLANDPVTLVERMKRQGKGP